MTLQDKTYAAMSMLSSGDPDVLVSSMPMVGVATVTLTLDTSAYASGDVLAATQVVSGALRSSGGYGKVIAVTVLDKDDQAQALDLIFLNGNKSIGTENAAVSMTDADAEYITGVVEVAAADYVDLVNCQVALVSGLNVPVVGATGTTDIYIAAISRGTGTYTASGIVLKLFIEKC